MKKEKAANLKGVIFGIGIAIVGVTFWAQILIALMEKSNTLAIVNGVLFILGVVMFTGVIMSEFKRGERKKILLVAICFLILQIGMTLLATLISTLY